MVTIRKAKTEDYKIIAQIHSQSWRNHYRGIMSDEFLSNEVESYHLEKWKTLFIAPPQNLLVMIASVQDTAAGFIAAYLKQDNTYGTLIDNLHILLPFQGKGIGKKLMQSLAYVMMEEYQLFHYHLWVFEKNHEAIKFYDAMKGEKVEKTMYPMPDGIKHSSLRYHWNNLKEI